MSRIPIKRFVFPCIIAFPCLSRIFYLWEICINSMSSKVSYQSRLVQRDDEKYNKLSDGHIFML